jgi:mRNA-degrading endonuclease RelE of RelBE toxin-antitoxin system
MARAPLFDVQLTREATTHLDSIDPKYHRMIASRILEQLSHDPNVPTRNRKPLRLPAPFDATWELRFGPHNRFRVLYDLNVEALTVIVVAIGEKLGNRLIIGGEDVVS